MCRIDFHCHDRTIRASDPDILPVALPAIAKKPLSPTGGFAKGETTRVGGRARSSERRKSDSPIQVSAACTFLPFLKLMLNLGAPVDRWLEECKLPYQLYEDPETYIPTKNYWAFVSLAEAKEAIDDLGLRVGQDQIYETHGFPLVASTYAAPTLLSGIQAFSRGVRRIYSGTGIVLARGEKDSVKLVLKKSFDIDIPGFTTTEWLGIISLIAVVQLFARRTWQPEVISLRSNRVVPPLAQAMYPNTHIIRGQETSYISFPKQMLSSGPSSFGGEVVARLESESLVTSQLEPPVDFADSVQRILASYLPDGYLSLESVAEIAGISPRTMQRSLAKDGLNFSWLVERTRFDIASRILVETESSSLDIAFATGYEDSSHFARAFKGLAGCSPREYRRRNADPNREESGA